MATLEHRVIAPNGEIRWQQWIDRVLFDDSGHITEFQGTGRDITEQKKAEEEKANLEAQLQQVQKMESIGKLAGGVAHDFNNMLGGIMGYASILLTGETDAYKITNLKGIIKAAQRAGELTQNLLAFGRRGKNLILAVNLNYIVTEVYSLLERSIDKSIRLHTHFEKELYLVDADPAQMNQLIMNLCVNAAEAMPNGGTLTAKTRNITLNDSFCKLYPDIKPGEYVELRVTDTGYGMNDKVKQQIFDPFFTTKMDGFIKGTGLGLSTVYGIVMNHSGAIHVDSKVNQGTIFTIYLPRGKKQQEVETGAGKGIKYGHGTILVVEDEEIVRNMVKTMIEELGYTVIMANNGAEGVKIYQERYSKIDGVLLDMQMPDMGGEETFIKMKEINPHVRVLLSTGYGCNEAAQQIIDLGVKDLLSKPYQVDILSEKLNKLCE